MNGILSSSLFNFRSSVWFRGFLILLIFLVLIHLVRLTSNSSCCDCFHFDSTSFHFLTISVVSLLCFHAVCICLSVETLIIVFGCGHFEFLEQYAVCITCSFAEPLIFVSFSLDFTAVAGTVFSVLLLFAVSWLFS